MGVDPTVSEIRIRFPNFMSAYLGVNVLNVKALVGAFNQEKALV